MRSRMHTTKNSVLQQDFCVNNSQDPFVTNSPRNKESYWWRDKFRFAESVAPCNSIILINKKGSALPSTTLRHTILHRLFTAPAMRMRCTQSEFLGRAQQRRRRRAVAKWKISLKLSRSAENFSVFPRRKPRTHKFALTLSRYTFNPYVRR